MPRTRNRLWTSVALLVVVAILGWLTRRGEQSQIGVESGIEQLFSSERSGVMVESAGVVSKVLRDDLEGSRHQRLIVRLPSGHTVLISHNIDVAPRVEDLSQGDSIAFRGQYEWNDKGGVIHWTHHDPDGRRPGGWIEHDGRRYR